MVYSGIEQRGGLRHILPELIRNDISFGMQAFDR